MTKKKHFHFMGIAGIGMSAIALVLKKRGFIVSGCDIDITNANCKKLIQAGCKIYQEHNNKECSDPSITTLVYTTMISSLHPEIIAAQKKKIECLHRSEVLGILTTTDSTIAVAGSHGKTTTSALVSHLFITSNKKPSIIIGGNLSTIQGNAQNGSDKVLIIEADESDRSFLNLSPTYSIITNIDFEHLETYKNIKDLQNTFLEFIRKTPSHGFVIACNDDTHIQELLPLLSCTTITYGYHPDATWRISKDQVHADYSLFTLSSKNNTYNNIKTGLAGKHNILNSAAAFIMGLSHGIDEKDLRIGLETFPGVDRRFTYKGTTNTGAQVFDDYGHHPKEIAATLEIAYKKPHQKLIVVFQPHRYSRTAGLWNDFLEVFASSSIDQLIVTDIHSAHEDPIENINSQEFVKQLNIKNPTLKAVYVPFDNSFQFLKNAIFTYSSTNDLILLQGAGKITYLADIIIN